MDRQLDYLCQQITNLEERMEQQVDPVAFGELRGEVRAMGARIDRLTNDVEKLTAQVAQIAEMMTEAKGGWRAIAWVAGVAGALGGAITWAVQHITVR